MEGIMSVEKQSFGTTKKGEAISLYTVTNKNGMVMKVTDFGAILVSPGTGQKWCADRCGIRI